MISMKRLHKAAVRLHDFNRTTHRGWETYINPYLTMLWYISIPEIIMAKFFPDLLTSATLLAAVSFAAMIVASYVLGKRHEHFDRYLKRRRRAR
jgi:hypothetical protein